MGEAYIEFVKEYKPPLAERLATAKGWLALTALSSSSAALIALSAFGGFAGLLTAAACAALPAYLAYCARKAWEVAEYDLAHLLTLGATARAGGVTRSVELEPKLSAVLGVHPLAPREEWARLTPDEPLRRVARSHAASPPPSEAEVVEVEADFASARGELVEEARALAEKAAEAVATAGLGLFCALALLGGDMYLAGALVALPCAVALSPFALLSPARPGRGLQLLLAALMLAVAAAPLARSLLLALALLSAATIAGLAVDIVAKREREAAVRACDLLLSSTLPPAEAVEAIRYEDRLVRKQLERPPRFDRPAGALFKLLGAKAISKGSVAFASWVLRRREGWGMPAWRGMAVASIPIATPIVAAIAAWFAALPTSFTPPAFGTIAPPAPALPSFGDALLGALPLVTASLPLAYVALSLLYDRSFAGKHAAISCVAAALGAQLAVTIFAGLPA